VRRTGHTLGAVCLRRVATLHERAGDVLIIVTMDSAAAAAVCAHVRNVRHVQAVDVAQPSAFKNSQQKCSAASREALGARVWLGPAAGTAWHATAWCLLFWFSLTDPPSRFLLNAARCLDQTVTEARPEATCGQIPGHVGAVLFSFIYRGCHLEVYFQHGCCCSVRFGCSRSCRLETPSRPGPHLRSGSLNWGC